MDTPYMGMIMLFAGNFEIRGWAFCNGRLMSIAQNTALFSLLGTTYGGDGIQTFGLPDLRSRVPIGMGQGPGLSSYVEGQAGGTETNTLVVSNLPPHNHSLNVSVQVSTANAASDEPNNSFLTTTSNNFYATSGTAGNNLGGVSGTVGITGSGTPVNNLSPYLALNYLIALEGIYPSRN